MGFVNKPGRVVSTAFKPVMLAGVITLPAAVQATGVLDQTGSSGGKLTFTADKYGTYGNDIDVIIQDGETAGSETVSVSGTVITVGIESGVSTSAQIKTALDGDTDAAALISVVDDSTAAITAATAITTSLASGAGDGADLPSFVSSCLPTATAGQYELILKDEWYDGLFFNAVVHVDDASTSSVVAKCELMNADAFDADLLAKNALEIHMIDFAGAEVVVNAASRLHLMIMVSESTRN